MRILVVCSDADIGGAERLLVSLAAAKRIEDRLHLVVLMGRGSLSAQLESAFDETTYLGFPPTSRDLPGMVRALERAVRDVAPDVVWSHLFHADLVTLLARFDAPRVTTVHTQRLTRRDHPLTRLIARAVGALSFRFRAVVPTSDSQQMHDFLRKLRMRNVVDAIPNAAGVPDQIGFDPRARRFLSLARNHPVKGHRELFRAFALISRDHPEWELVAYGPGVTEGDPAMRELLSEPSIGRLHADGRLRLMGPTEHPEHELSQASALVISSLYGETFPLVGVEAAGLGIPVITTDIGSCAEFADDERFSLPAGDVTALAEAMAAYADADDLERTRLSTMARSRAEMKYDPRATYEKYRGLFSSSLVGAGSTQR